MDQLEDWTTGARPSWLKQKLEVDGNKDVESNSTTRITSFSTAAQTPASSCKPCSNRWSYDVFLSFRGEDTRKNFTDHLYSALVQAGVRTFRDDDELRGGENISTKLLHAIRGSRISIAVLSKGYASSKWCLDELVEILRCTKTRGQTLLPVFYDANPSDIRKQTGTFAEAFARHEERFQEDMERVQRWRAALTEAADLSGWDLQNAANGYESRLIKGIIEEVLSKVNRSRLQVATHPIGIDIRVKQMKDLLKLGTSDVRIAGIYGMGGIGKTTLAKALYNNICDGFEGSSCLLHIKEVSGQLNGLVQLQEQLIYDILKMKNVKIHNAEEGIKLIEKLIQRKRVLIVLDGIDRLKQLHGLVGDCQWFSLESRVIVTTRDEQVLTQLGVHGKYKVTELNGSESLQLFCWHAFKMPHPKEGFQELSICAVMYTGRLPLALEVLGSFLLGRRVGEWEDELEKLHKIPHKEIHEILHLSFKSLDHYTKKIFLDIACFFLDMDKEYVIRILRGSDFFPDIGFSVLIQRSLLTIDLHNKLRMHDLIRDMGREIVRKKSPNNLGRRSRLWFHEDVLNMLSKHLCSSIEAGHRYRVIVLLGSEIPDWFSCQTIGSSLSFHVPSLSDHNRGIFVTCAVLSFKKEPQKMWSKSTDVYVVIHNKTRGYRHVVCLAEGYEFLANESDHLFLMKGLVIGNEVIFVGLFGVVKLDMISGEEIETSIEVSGSAQVKKCGVHLVVDEPEVIDKSGSTGQCVDTKCGL